MPSTLALLAPFIPLSLLLYTYIIHPLFISPLSRIPGPKLYALTKWRLAYDDLTGRRTRVIDALHRKHGPVVRIGPNEIAFNSLSALRTIYGAGSGFERTSFYSMFDVYGHKNLFTFQGVKEHGDRKKLLAHAYSKSAIVKGSEGMVKSKALDYMNLVEEGRKRGADIELFSTLHYFSIDSITEFLYGGYGRTACLKGGDRGLLGDILDVRRRRLSWFAVHLPGFTRWLYAQTGILGSVLKNLYPMQKPTTYTEIRRHALEAWKRFYISQTQGEKDVKEDTIIGKLWQHHESNKKGGLGDLDIASECADHLLAGIDTTADTLLFLVWALSRPENAKFQAKLRDENRAMSATDFDSNGIPTLESSDKLPYLDAVIKETLRLYAPLPATEPRFLGRDIMIDGYTIPARTDVGMSPFSLHRNPEVFTDPLKFDPERWFGEERQVTEMKKWFWAFSSGGRMCIGLHLAMAEMTTFATAVYRKYRTELGEGFADVAPGVTSRFEVFHDDTLENVAEHECNVRFIPA